MPATWQEREEAFIAVLADRASDGVVVVVTTTIFPKTFTIYEYSKLLKHQKEGALGKSNC